MAFGFMSKPSPLFCVAAVCGALLSACRTSTSETAAADGLSPLERREAADVAPRVDDPSSPRGGSLRVVDGAAPLGVKKF